MILVVGATGLLGGAITRRLLEQGRDVRVLLREGSPDLGLVDAGAQPAFGDLKQRQTIAAAVEGVDVVVTTANSAFRSGDDTVESVDVEGNRTLIDAAASAGVRRFLFVSAAGADASSPDPFVRAKAATEERVRASGMSWTVVSPTPFLDIWIPAVVGGPAVSGGVVTLVGEGRRRHSFIAVADVAAYVVAAVDHPEARDTTLLVGGPQPVTWRDVIAEVERVVGRRLEVTSVRPGDPVPGLPAQMVGLLAFLDTFDSEVDMDAMSRTYGVRGTSLRDIVPQLMPGDG